MRSNKKRVYYFKNVEYKNSETYEDTEIPEGFMTFPKFIDWCNKNFGLNEMGNKYTADNVVPMLEKGQLNKKHGRNKLEIRRCLIPGIYHGTIIKVIGPFYNTVKRKKQGQAAKGKLYYFPHTEE